MQIAPAGENELTTKIIELEQAIESVAEQAVQRAIGDDDYTALEVQAMVAGQKLKLTNALELAAILFRGKYLHEIETGNLMMVHPGQYSNLAEMAADNGISQAELSKTLNLVKFVFPALIELGYDVTEVWNSVGKSKMSELVPVLRQLITGEVSDSERVRASVDNILNDIAATAAVAGQEMSEEEMRHEAIQQLVEDGQNLSFRRLRERINPDPTPVINAAIIPANGHRYLMTVVTQDQWDLLNRRLGGKLEPQIFELPADHTARQREAAMIPEVRAILDLINGVA
jgi:hypothetical protein